MLNVNDIKVVDISKTIGSLELPDPISVFGMPSKSQLDDIIANNNIMVVWLTHGGDKDNITTAKFIKRFMKSLVAQQPNKFKDIFLCVSIIIIPLKKQGDRNEIVASYMATFKNTDPYKPPAGKDLGKIKHSSILEEDPFYYNMLKKEVE